MLGWRRFPGRRGFTRAGPRAALGVPAALLALVLCCPARSLAQEETVRAAVAAQSANVSAFPFYRCRFRETNGEATNLEDAINGKLSNARDIDHLFITDGDKVRFE